MLSELSTVAPMVISDFENGKTDITVGNLLLIADVLGVTLGDLVKLK
ncbi:XRE family transcriptional regulator [Periweissella cryptocerci]|uniref:XRE family transcriptional regulator n=1 Tax=Periweissella cryptocerci TaxID=2506420 RepID=A0A4V1AIW7_9LACO|nr:XRE family transcriptional regulator [Periweissella cryptocerci]